MYFIIVRFRESKTAARNRVSINFPALNIKTSSLESLFASMVQRHKLSDLFSSFLIGPKDLLELIELYLEL